MARAKTENLPGQTDLELEVKARAAYEQHVAGYQYVPMEKLLEPWDNLSTPDKDSWRRKINNQTIESSSIHGQFYEAAPLVVGKAVDLGSSPKIATFTRDLKPSDTEIDAEVERIYPSRQPAAVKLDDGKPDYTLIPWRIVAAGSPHLALIKPLEAWWLKLISAGEATADARAAWGAIGRSYEADLAAALNFGAAKYAPWNYTLGWSTKRGYAGACRHFVAMEAGEVTDPESGLDHHCHLAFYYTAIHVAHPDDRTGLPEGSRY